MRVEVNSLTRGIVCPQALRLKEVFSLASPAWTLYILTLLGMTHDGIHEHRDPARLPFLDKGDSGLAFYKADLYVKLKVSSEADKEIYLKLLHDSEKGCLVSNSLITEVTLHPELFLEG